MNRRAALLAVVALWLAVLVGCSSSPAASTRNWYLGNWKLDAEETERIFEAAGQLDQNAATAIQTRSHCSLTIANDTIHVELFGTSTVTTYKVIFGAENTAEFLESMKDGSVRKIRVESIGVGRMKLIFGESPLAEVWDKVL